MPKNIGVVLSLKDRFSTGLKKVGENLSVTEKKIKKVSSQFRKLSNGMKQAFNGAMIATGAVVGTVGALATKTAQAGDRIDKMSQKIGMSRKSFQEWDYIMSQNGGNVDSLQMGYKTLATQMDGVRKGSKDSINAFNKLGVSVRGSNGALRSQDEVFNEVVRKLQAIKNPTEKAILAQKLFGKSAIEMKPLLNQSADSIDNLRQKANDLGMVMSDDAIDASVKFTDTMDTLKRSFGAIGLSIGAGLIPHLQQVADMLINNLPQIKQTLIPVIQNLGNILGFLFQHLDVIIPAITALGGAFATLQIISTVAGFVSAFCNPIGLAVLGVTALVSAIGICWAKCEGFRNMVGALVAVVKMLAIGAWNIIKPIAEFGAKMFMLLTPVGLLIKGLQAVFGLINGIAQKFGGWRGIGDKIKNWADDKSDKMSGKNAPKHALGTSYFAGGATSINEGGRGEIVNLPSGSQIIPHDIAKTQNKNISIKVDFNIEGNVIGKSELFNEFAQVLVTQIQNKLQTV